MDIVAPDGRNRAVFCKLFKDYYGELDCDEDMDHLLDEYVLADYAAGLLSIAVAREGDAACGFVIWQVDARDNEWCLKEGMGTVRELYVAPAARQKGMGSALVRYAEGKLAAQGADTLYVLPAEGSQAFFLSLGYAEADEYCEETDCNFFYKQV